MNSSSTLRLEKALQYAARGWYVLPLHWTINGKCSCRSPKCTGAGKHPYGKLAPNGFHDATKDPATIERWFRAAPRINIGIATGATGLTVLDIDGPGGKQQLDALNVPVPPTLAVRTGREGGWHFYYAGTEAESSQVKGEHLDVRGTTGYVVAPPSMHATGRQYEWANEGVLPAPCPAWVAPWVRSRASYKAEPQVHNVPEYLRLAALPRLAERAASGMTEPWSPEQEARLRSALATIPADLDGRTWFSYGGAIHDLNWPCGIDIFDDWSKTSKGEGAGNGEYKGRADIEKRWAKFDKGKAGIKRTTLGSIYADAANRGWVYEEPAAEPRQEQPEAPKSDAADQTEANGVHFPFEEDSDPKALIALNDLNKKYSVIGDIGGKCLVLSWVPSRVDDGVKIASFQSFKSFSEYYGNRYIKIRKEKGDGEITEKSEPLGPYWLKWRRRLTYQGLDLVPGAERVLPDGTLNLWRGYAVEPRAGSWRLMQRHIVEILASGDRASAEYIFRFAAWAVQHPGERAEVALVFKGDKGSGKGTFANALKRLFGAHGLQIYSSKHLVGAFNGHLRSCLLLFADEAFWAGDKQGESVLKGMLTESTLMIEQKGVDAVAWKNRLHVIMAANAEWVVPASHDERRYMVIDVSRDRIGDFAYFKALHDEINAGGLAAMLHDLQRVNLGDWHPRNVIQTEALRQQKERSLDPRHEWWESLLQGAVLPGGRDAAGDVPAHAIYRHARETVPRLKEASETALGRFLRVMGCHGIHKKMGNYWHFPTLKEARGIWCSKFSKWDWRNDLEDWHG